MALLIAKLSITHGGVVPELWRTCGGIVAFFMPVLFFSLFSLCLFDIKSSKWSKQVKNGSAD